MDKIAKLFHDKLEALCDEHKNKIRLIPLWQLDSSLPKEIKAKALDEKIEYLIESYKTSNPIYSLLNNDLKLLNDRNISLDKLKSLNIDPRYLESIGFNEIQIDIYYEFVSKVKNLI